MCHLSPVTCFAYFLSYVSQDCDNVEASIGCFSWELDGTDRHNRETDIPTYRLNQPRGQFSTNKIINLFHTCAALV